MGAIDASEEAQVQQQQGSGDGPIDVAGPVNLSALFVVGIGKFTVVRVADAVAVLTSGVTASHSKVREGCGDGDEGGDDVVEAALGGNIPRHYGKRTRGDKHHGEDYP